VISIRDISRALDHEDAPQAHAAVA
jgi:hypothetical protein